MIGCSLCGWNDLSVYKSEDKFKYFIQKIQGNFSLYELPILFNTEKYCKFLSSFDIPIYSFHASKGLWSKERAYIQYYLFAVVELTNRLRVSNVVIHFPYNLSPHKLRLIISILKEKVSFENTSPAFWGNTSLYQTLSCTIDSAHARYQKQFGYIFSNHLNISHFHIRGYSRTINYVPLAEDTSSMTRFIKYAYLKYKDSPLILEYPYHDISQALYDKHICEQIINLAKE